MKGFVPPPRYGGVQYGNEPLPITREITVTEGISVKDLAEKLVATYPAKLEEGNNWGDTTWGTVNGVGHNLLGLILMDVRKELRSSHV